MATLAIPRGRTAPLRYTIEWVRGIARAVGASADGLVVGLVIAYVGLTAAGAPASFLGVPDAIAFAVVGSAIAGAVLLAAATAVALRRMVRRVTLAVQRRPEVAGRRHVRSLSGLPDRFLNSLPIAWLAAFGVLLWIVLVGQYAFAPLALLMPPGSTVPFLYVIGIVGAVLGLARAIGWTHGNGRLPGLWRHRARTALVVLAAAILVGATSIAFWPGDSAGFPPPSPAYDGQLSATTLADPGAPGTFAVEQLTYGSGLDARRPEFGSGADLVTETVDASKVLDPLGPGADAARAWFWGFDTGRLPVQGIAWLPVGQGPFPLVLIVHGNHAMGDFSEFGYAYLGEHLASRGFIATSVDEDFLNGSWADDYHGSEQLVRAWLLLVHLDAWRTWTAPDGPLAGRVDLDRVALVGHSRGGEAASVAAKLAQASGPPWTGITPWPTGLDVDAVVSIAPSDGQYTGSLYLDGVDLLELQGGWDADARAWSGIRQYARTKPDTDGFVAGLWVYRANHGQFNTVWGDADFGPHSPAILNLAPLLSGGDQRDVAKTAIGAFLAASLQGEDGYRGLFRRPMTGREWLPDDVVIVRSRSGDAIELTRDGPDHPIDGLTVATSGGTARTIPIPLRALQPNQAMRGTLLRWDAGSGVASWSINGLSLGAGGRVPGALRIALADGRAPEHQDGTPLPVAIRAEAGAVTARIPLDRFGALPPPLPVRLAKHDLLASAAGIDLSLRSPSEVVLQTYEVPLSAFVEADPAFDPARLTGLVIEIPRSGDGAIWIAEPALVP